MITDLGEDTELEEDQLSALLEASTTSTDNAATTDTVLQASDEALAQLGPAPRSIKALKFQMGHVSEGQAFQMHGSAVRVAVTKLTTQTVNAVSTSPLKTRSSAVTAPSKPTKVRKQAGATKSEPKTHADENLVHPQVSDEGKTADKGYNIVCPKLKCSGRLKSVAGLKYHLRTLHDEELRYKCEYCTLDFPSARERQNHQKSHEKKVTFCQHCKIYNSVWPHDVVRHENKCVESPTKKFSCTRCSKVRVFSGEGALMQHLKNNHKLKGDFICCYCKTLFVSDELLQEHKCSVKRKR